LTQSATKGKLAGLLNQGRTVWGKTVKASRGRKLWAIKTWEKKKQKEKKEKATSALGQKWRKEETKEPRRKVKNRITEEKNQKQRLLKGLKNLGGGVGQNKYSPQSRRNGNQGENDMPDEVKEAAAQGPGLGRVGSVTIRIY